MKTIAAGIFARGGSKGVPRKNIRPLGGKPLIGYAIEVALASSFIDYVFVSTDDEEIAAVARHFGADVPFMRPPELATDTAPERLSWQHALQTLAEASKEIDILVSVPATSPFRNVDDVDGCIQRLLNTNADIVVTVTDAHRSPYFNMVTLSPDHTAQLVIEGRFARRQDTPTVYDMTTVAYAARKSHILQTNHPFEGDVKAVYVPPERAIDIDTELDFKFAEFLMGQHEKPE